MDFSENSFSNNNCFINSNPIDNYMYDDISQSISRKNENKININKKKYKEHKDYILYNLNHPKLIEAYNEGYYGINNVPKQFYIYPRFCNTGFSFKQNKKVQENNINKENDFNIMNNINLNNLEYINNQNGNNSISTNEEFISTYTNYPYPKLINISNNLFGSSHQSKQEFHDELINEKIDSKLTFNNNEIKNLDNNNNNDEDSGNFYFINNNITKRNVPFQNNPDDISIDDDDLEK